MHRQCAPADKGCLVQCVETTSGVGQALPAAAGSAGACCDLPKGLEELGWSVGRNVRIEYWWGAGDADRYRKYAAELLALSPDIILTAGAAVVHMQQATRTVAIVFVGIADPVGAGLVASLARPGGNATGFTPFEYGISGKWLELPDFASIAHVDRAYLDPERRRHGLNCRELGNPSRDGRVPEDRRARHAWRDLPETATPPSRRNSPHPTCYGARGTAYLAQPPLTGSCPAQSTSVRGVRG
jgi:hypothetical protein